MVPFSSIGLFVLSVADWSVLHFLKMISPHSPINADIPFILNFNFIFHFSLLLQMQFETQQNIKGLHGKPFYFNNTLIVR